ncbi:MFS transporter, partial [Stenotrophomonas maltophilia]|uniref:MFS transporter n=1 Tax=Stenotrophomonas maltophilia TaxID=40324 RepID=UPI0013DD0AF7
EEDQPRHGDHPPDPAPRAGWITARQRAGALGGIGMVIAVAGLILLAFLPADPSWFDIAWRMSLTGAGFGMF